MDNIEQFWDSVLAQIEQRIAKPSFEAWLKSTKAIHFDGNAIIVAVPNEFVCTWLERNYTVLIEEVLKQLTNQNMAVHFIIQEDDEAVILPPIKTQSPKPMPSSDVNGMLNPKYTFDTFVIGSGNRFAHAASLAVAEALLKLTIPSLYMVV